MPFWYRQHVALNTAFMGGMIASPTLLPKINKKFQVMDDASKGNHPWVRKTKPGPGGWLSQAKKKTAHNCKCSRASKPFVVIKGGPLRQVANFCKHVLAEEAQRIDLGICSIPSGDSSAYMVPCYLQCNVLSEVRQNIQCRCGAEQVVLPTRIYFISCQCLKPPWNFGCDHLDCQNDYTQNFRAVWDSGTE